MHPYRAKNVKLQKAILERLDDLVAQDPESVAVAMATSILPVLATKYGASQGPQNLAAIQKNYPDATPALARERALTEEGVHLAVAILTQVRRLQWTTCPVPAL